MKHAVCMVGLSLFLMGSPSPAAANLKAARQLLQQGKYDAARAAFKRAARGRDRGAAIVGEAKTWMRVGQYDKAARTAKRALRLRGARDAAHAIYGEALAAVGKYADAIKVLEPFVKRNNSAYFARVILGRLFDTVGDDLKAKVQWKDFFRDWDNGSMDKKRADHTYYHASAGYWNDNFKYVHDALVKAGELDAKFLRAHVDLGWLYLSKFDVPGADEAFKKVVKVDPNHADALTGWAWVEWYARRPRRARGKKRATKALEINPNQVEAMLYLVSMLLYDKEYADARKLIDRALKVNPNHLRALSHLAALHFLQEDQAAFAKVKDRVFKINARYSTFYYLVSVFARRHHLYKESAALAKKAKEVNHNDAQALAALGEALLRIGEEGDGLLWLQDSWKLDKFNHKVKNLLNLYDDINGTGGQKQRYETVRLGKFQFRFAKDETKLLSRFVGVTLNEALDSYIAKYRFKPELPVIVELYDKQEDFQVRTFGEPAHGGILGVCFGRVITALSPSLARSSWAKVLWHELAHTMHLHRSKGKVPRWFTEGLAEYETIIKRKYWRREHRLALYRSIKMKVAHDIKQLNRAFTHSKTAGGVVRAYFQSSQVIWFIAKKWGQAALNKALELYAQNKTTAQVIPAITGLDTKTFDQRFFDWIARKYAFYAKNFDPFVSAVVSLEVLKARATKAPGDATAQAHLAAAYFLRAKMPKEGLAALQRASALKPNHPIVRFLKAEVAYRRNEHGAAEGVLQQLRKAGHDGYFVRIRLAAIAKKGKRIDDALAHWEAAKPFDPDSRTPYLERWTVFKKRKDDAAQLKELTGLADIREGDGALHYSIVKLAGKLKRWALLRRFAPRAIEVQPLNAMLHESYAWALKQNYSNQAALRAFETALIAVPHTVNPKNKPAWMSAKESLIFTGMAEIHLLLRRKKKALALVQKALRYDPNNTRAIALRKRVDPSYRPGGE